MNTEQVLIEMIKNPGKKFTNGERVVSFDGASICHEMSSVPRRSLYGFLTAFGGLTKWTEHKEPRVEPQGHRNRGPLMSKRGLIMQVIREASVCWTGTPAGAFNAERAIAIADKLLADLDRYDEEAHTEYMANLALESEVAK